MRVDSWVWNLGGDYPGVNNNDAELPIGRVTLKTHESSRWYSAAQLEGFARIYRDQGIGFYAWCVPTGLADDAGLAISVLNDLRAAGIEEPWLQLDVEVEPGNFWLGTPAQLRGVFERIRAACPWAKLILCCYQFDNATFGIDQVAPLCDWLCTMSYWNDFGTSPEARMQFEVSRLARHGKPIQFGLPGNAPAHEMTRALAWLDPRGGLEIAPVIWRRGTTTRATWDAIAAFEPTVAPPPPDPGIDWQAAYDGLAVEVGDWLVADAAGAQMRAERLRELGEWRATNGAVLGTTRAPRRQPAARSAGR